MKIGSICSGYGGLDMAVEYVFQAETIWMSDIDKSASISIQKNWNLPNLGDIKTVDWDDIEPIDILTAGYPCQPFSNAGQRKGVKDERHIWPYINQIISKLRPKYVILENVKGHLSLGFKEVLKDLTNNGYDSKWSIIRASDIGAPHRRERLFVIAKPTNTNSIGFDLRELRTQGSQGQPQLEFASSAEIISNTKHIDWSHDWQTSKMGRKFATRFEMSMRRTPNPLDNGKVNLEFVEYMMGLPEGWVTNLPISRAQKYKLLGNGVVPQQAELALNTLLKMPSDLVF